MEDDIQRSVKAFGRVLKGKNRHWRSEEKMTERRGGFSVSLRYGLCTKRAGSKAVIGLPRVQLGYIHVPKSMLMWDFYALGDVSSNKMVSNFNLFSIFC